MSFCSSWLGLSHRTPILLAAIGLTQFTNQVGNNPGPGDRYGTADLLAQQEQRLVSERSELPAKVAYLRANFDKLDAKPTEDQVRLVLKRTDACTDTRTQDVLNNPDESREIAWILYLDTYSRGGIKEADQLFKK
jgi:hypothetical protein